MGEWDRNVSWNEASQDVRVQSTDVHKYILRIIFLRLKNLYNQQCYIFFSIDFAKMSFHKPNTIVIT